MPTVNVGLNGTEITVDTDPVLMTGSGTQSITFQVSASAGGLLLTTFQIVPPAPNPNPIAAPPISSPTTSITINDNLDLLASGTITYKLGGKTSTSSNLSSGAHQIKNQSVGEDRARGR